MAILANPSAALIALDRSGSCSAFTAGRAGFRRFTCDGVTENKIDCDSALEQGIAEYCEDYARSLVPGNSIFALMNRTMCMRACQAVAAVDCTYDPTGGGTGKNTVILPEIPE